jgi:hypothetical protein
MGYDRRQRKFIETMGRQPGEHGIRAGDSKSLRGKKAREEARRIQQKSGGSFAALPQGLSWGTLLGALVAIAVRIPGPAVSATESVVAIMAILVVAAVWLRVRFADSSTVE